MRRADRPRIYYGAPPSVASECADEEVYVIGGRIGRPGRDVPVPRRRIGDHRGRAPSLEASMSIT